MFQKTLALHKYNAKPQFIALSARDIPAILLFIFFNFNSKFLFFFSFFFFSSSASFSSSSSSMAVCNKRIRCFSGALRMAKEPVYIIDCRRSL